jgi:cadmium resistance protein CadD (predicted permease)
MRGQAMTEFLLVTAALVFALLTPFVQGKSVAGLLLDALLGSLRAQAYLLSIL